MTLLVQMRVPRKDRQNNEQSLLNQTWVVKNVNSKVLWRDSIEVKAFQGREASIAAMLNYVCDIAIDLSGIVFANPSKLTAEYMRVHFLEGNVTASNGTFASNVASVVLPSTISNFANPFSTMSATVPFNQPDTTKSF